MKNLREILDHWGGGKAAFFTYTHMSHDSLTGVLQALISVIRDDLQLNYLQSGLLLSAYTVTSGVAQIPWGYLGDRVSRKNVIALGLGGVAVTALAVGLMRGYYPTFAILITMGIFAGAYHPSAVSLLSSFFDGSKKGKAIALHMVGGSIGFTIGPIAGGIIAAAFGWRWSYILLSLPVMIAVPIVLRRFAHPRGSTIKAAADGKTREKRPSLLRVIKGIAVPSALVVTSQFISGTALGFLAIYLVDKHHISPTESVLWIGAVRGAGIPGSLFGGWLSDRWDRKLATYSVLVAFGLVMYLLSVLPFNAAFIGLLLVFGGLVSMRQSTFQPLLLESTPASLSATVFGIYFGLGMEGVSVIQPVAGQFMDMLGIQTVFSIIAFSGLGLSAVTFLVATMLMLRSRPGRAIGKSLP